MVRGALARGDAICNAAAGSAVVEAEHQAGPFGCAAMDEGKDAERPVRSEQARLRPIDEREVWPPHQRTVGKHPEVFTRMLGIKGHDLISRNVLPCASMIW